MLEPNDQTSPSGRPTSVIVVAAFNFVIGGLLLLFALATLVSLLPYFTDPGSHTGGIIEVIAGATAVLTLPFVLIFLLAAIGLWRLRKWGLVLAFISCILCLVAGLGTAYGIATSPGGGGFFTVSGLLSLIVVIAGAVQLYFLFQHGFRAQFR